ncbi:MAG: PfkB family carbohydrate kinase [Promethearchaeota archaeon]
MQASSKETYDLFSFGNLSIDIIKTKNSRETSIGGAILHAAWTAYQLGYKICILTKTNIHDINLLEIFPQNRIKIYWVSSAHTTSIQNEYLTDDKEVRICTSISEADEFFLRDFPQIDAKIYQYAALEIGEISHENLKTFSKKGKLAVDAQGMIRKVLPNKKMEYYPWKGMEELMPYITYFKADATEAKFLTGINTETHEGRVKAGKKFVELGAKEVVITYNKELISISEESVYSFPFKNRNLSGRTGRGDTSFTTYILERLNKSQKDATLFAAAVASLKMENPGPFKKTREDVKMFIDKFYSK